MARELNVVCFGEILWDVLPTARKLGGAPMNVSYHLNRLGIKSSMISKVGNDALGEELIDFLMKMELSTQHLQIDAQHKTSEVLATLGENDEMIYEIVQPVAWDFIEYHKEYEALVRNADLFVFGSLAARSKTSRDTLYQLIEAAKFKLFDVNFRSPHYNRKTVEHLLMKADAVKLNENEAVLIGEWVGASTTSESTRVAEIMDRYQLQEVVLTKGGQGASYYTPTSRHDYKAFSVQVKDTVGSGDSFLAAFIAQKLLGKSIDDTVEYATALGAYVTTHAGANPPYKMTDLNHFIWKKTLERMNWKY